MQKRFDMMKSKLIDVAIFPFIAIGGMMGLIMRCALIGWNAAKLGFMEANGGAMG